MGTIEPRSPTSRLARASDKCAGSNLQVKRNVSYRCTESSKISSAWDDICYVQTITESSEHEPS